MASVVGHEKPECRAGFFSFDSITNPATQHAPYKKPPVGIPVWVDTEDPMATTYVIEAVPELTIEDTASLMQHIRNGGSLQSSLKKRPYFDFGSPARAYLTLVGDIGLNGISSIATKLFELKKTSIIIRYLRHWRDRSWDDTSGIVFFNFPNGRREGIHKMPPMSLDNEHTEAYLQAYSMAMESLLFEVLEPSLYYSDDYKSIRSLNAYHLTHTATVSEVLRSRDWGKIVSEGWGKYAN